VDFITELFLLGVTVEASPSVSCQLCSVTPIYFLLKNWRPFLVITVDFFISPVHSGVVHYFLHVPMLQKQLPLLLWGPFLWAPLLGRTRWTCLNPLLVWRLILFVLFVQISSGTPRSQSADWLTWTCTSWCVTWCSWGHSHTTARGRTCATCWPTAKRARMVPIEEEGEEETVPWRWRHGVRMQPALL